MHSNSATPKFTIFGLIPPHPDSQLSRYSHDIEGLTGADWMDSYRMLVSAGETDIDAVSLGLLCNPICGLCSRCSLLPLIREMTTNSSARV